MTIIQKIQQGDPRRKGFLSAFFGVLLISFDSVFIRLSGTGGVNTAFLFGFFTFLSISFVIQTSQPKGLAGTLKENGWPVVLSGLLIFGSASTLILSIKHTVVANTVVILGSRPVLTAVASWFFLKEKTRKSFWITMIAVMGGIGVVTSGSVQSGNLLGDSLAVLCVVFLALNGVLQRKYKTMSRMAAVGLGGFFMAAILSFFADFGSFTPGTWGIMAVNGLISAPLGRVLNMISTRYIPASEAALLSLCMSLFATLWAFLFFQEIPPMTTLLGGLIILGTISIYILATIRKAGSREAQ